MSAQRFRNCSVIFILVLVVGLAGCSLIPKRVEFFQDKVEPVPAKSETTKEHERQAAELIYRKVGEAKTAATVEQSSTNIVYPLTDALIVSDALKLSLGPPKKLWSDDSDVLALELRKELAVLNKKIDSFRADNEKNVGKKIEGSGWVSMSYFTYFAIFFGLLLVLSTAIKIWGMVNPIVGIGANVAKVPVKLLAQGFRQILAAGETFKESLDKKIEDPKTKELVLELFRVSQERNQNEEIQNIVKDLTK